MPKKLIQDVFASWSIVSQFLYTTRTCKSPCLLVALSLSFALHAQDFDRHEVHDAHPFEEPQFVLGKVSERWLDGKVNWYYNPANQPPTLSQGQVLEAIQTAIARWSAMCNVNFTYMGTTSVVPGIENSPSVPDGFSVFGWGQLTGDRARYGAYTRWFYSNGLMLDADILINTARNWTLENVEAIMTHEIGHALGLNHSNHQASVMFASPYNSYSYQRTLRGDDAEGCKALYDEAKTAKSARMMNWAESQFPETLFPSPAAAGTFSDYYYRYYSGTQSYVGTKDGMTYFMGPDGVIHPLAHVESFMPSAREAGF